MPPGELLVMMPANPLRLVAAWVLPPISSVPASTSKAPVPRAGEPLPSCSSRAGDRQCRRCRY